MSAVIFDKSDKGREEIATRRHGLPLRLRTLLLLMDGKQTVDNVLAKLSGIGVTMLHVQQLWREGFLHQVEGDPLQFEPELEPQPIPYEAVFPSDQGSPVAPSDLANELTPPTAILQAEALAIAEGLDAEAVESEAPEELPQIPVFAPGLSPVQKLYQFYTDTITSAVGLRGYSLQLKVESAESVEDFQQLREEYVQTLTRAKGRKFAAILERNLDLLLRKSATLPNAA